MHDIPEEKPRVVCPLHGLYFCFECLEDVPDASHLRRETIGPHPITGQVVVRWVHRDGCPEGATR